MAEPSLQLGNGNWAGKSGNLLAYHKANNNFYADELTFARASSGTRVNSDGLIETASVLSTTELVNNGDFATDTGWNKNANWSISGGVAIADGTSSADLNQGTLSAVIGTKYLVSFDVVSLSQGTFKTQIGGVSVTGNALGSFSGEVVATSTDRLRVIAQSNAIGSIDNVSVKEYTTSNVPRVDYLNNSKGSLLLESQRTNLVTYSEDFSNAYWTKSRSSITSNSLISPDGTLNASKFTQITSTAWGGIVLNISSSSTSTLSIFGKKIDNDYIAIIGHNSNDTKVYFNLANGTIGTIGGDVTSADIQDYGNGWFRCTLTASSINRFTVLHSTENNGATANLTTETALYGAQLEAGSYATSYIPTSGTTATRNLDTCATNGLSNVIGQTEGTIFMDVNISHVIGNEAIATINSGGYSNNTTFQRIGNVIEFVRNSATQSGASVESSSVITAGRHKMAIAYKSGDTSFYLNGTQVSTTQTQTFTNGTLTTLRLGGDAIGSLAIGDTYNQSQLYKTRLTNAELATLTTI